MASNIPTPEELRRTGQIIPTSKLIRWSENAGFVVRRATRSSHIVCFHPEFQDIRFNIIHDQGTPCSQRNLADALIELEKRRIEAIRSISAPFKTVTTENKLAAIKEKLPPYIEAETDHKTGKIVLRDQNLPQLGLTLEPGEERIIENKVRFLEDMKRETFILLNRARMNYDINTPMHRGVFTGKLNHSVYRSLETDFVEPYQAGESPDKLLNALQTYIGKVEDRDLEYQVRLEDALGNPAIKSLQTAFNARRGDRTNTVSYEMGGSTLSFDFRTTSNRRADTEHDSARITGKELARVEQIVAGIIEAAQAKLVPA